MNFKILPPIEIFPENNNLKYSVESGMNREKPVKPTLVLFSDL